MGAVGGAVGAGLRRERLCLPALRCADAIAGRRHRPSGDDEGPGWASHGREGAAGCGCGGVGTARGRWGGEVRLGPGFGPQTGAQAATPPATKTRRGSMSTGAAAKTTPPRAIGRGDGSDGGDKNAYPSHHEGPRAPAPRRPSPRHPIRQGTSRPRIDNGPSWAHNPKVGRESCRWMKVKG